MCLGAQADSEVEARLWGAGEARSKGRAEPRGLPWPQPPSASVTHAQIQCTAAGRGDEGAEHRPGREGWLPGGGGLAVLKPGLHPAGRVESRDGGQEGQISSELGGGGGRKYKIWLGAQGVGIHQMARG